jgi:hypothetical protein
MTNETINNEILAQMLYLAALEEQMADEDLAVLEEQMADEEEEEEAVSELFLTMLREQMADENARYYVDEDGFIASSEEE